MPGGVPMGVGGGLCLRNNDQPRSTSITGRAGFTEPQTGSPTSEFQRFVFGYGRCSAGHANPAMVPPVAGAGRRARTPFPACPVRFSVESPRTGPPLPGPASGQVHAVAEPKAHTEGRSGWPGRHRAWMIGPVVQVQLHGHFRGGLVDLRTAAAPGPPAGLVPGVTGLVAIAQFNAPALRRVGPLDPGRCALG